MADYVVDFPKGSKTSKPLVAKEKDRKSADRKSGGSRPRRITQTYSTSQETLNFIRDTEAELLSLNFKIKNLQHEAKRNDHIFCNSQHVFHGSPEELVRMDKEFDNWDNTFFQLIQLLEERSAKILELQEHYHKEIVAASKSHMMIDPEVTKLLSTSVLVASFPAETFSSDLKQIMTEAKVPHYESRVLTANEIQFDQKREPIQVDPFFRTYSGLCKNLNVMVLIPRDGIAGVHFSKIAEKLKTAKNNAYDLLFMGACYSPELLVFEKPSQIITLDSVYRTRGVGFFRKIQWIESICQAMYWFHNSPDAPCHLQLSPFSIFLNPVTFAIKIAHAERCGIPITDCKNYSAPTYAPTAYSAPEILHKVNNPTQAADVFSFGMIVYFILVERHPIPESLVVHEECSDSDSIASPRGKLIDKQVDYFRVGEEVKKGKRPDISFLPREIRQFLERCWVTNPKDRPSFIELRDFDFSSFREGARKDASKESIAIWKDFSSDGSFKAVPWECFVIRFVEFLGPITEIEHIKRQKKGKKEKNSSVNILLPSCVKESDISLPPCLLSVAPTPTQVRILRSPETESSQEQINSQLQSLFVKKPEYKPHKDAIEAYWKQKMCDSRTEVTSQSYEKTTAMNCLRATMTTHLKTPSDTCIHKSYIGDVVTYENYSKFCHIFGPILTMPSGAGNRWLESFVYICKQPWFFGNITTQYARDCLELHFREKNTKSAFLVRLSSNSAACTIDFYTKTKEGTPSYFSFRIEGPQLKNGLVVAVDNWVNQRENKAFKFVPCKYGRRYDAYFDRSGVSYKPISETEKPKETDVTPSSVVFYSRGTSHSFIS